MALAKMLASGDVPEVAGSCSYEADDTFSVDVELCKDSVDSVVRRFVLDVEPV